jgi:hypothetical protein
MRLQTERSPDAMHRLLGHAGRSRHRGYYNAQPSNPGAL